MMVRSLPTKERKKKLAVDVIDTSVTHFDLVRDITDTDCQTQNGSAHVRIFETFKRYSFNKPGNNLTAKML